MRADLWLVEQGYYESRARAQAAIKAGLVTVNGKALRKASEKIPDEAQITAEAEHAWVSRGGLKLVHALDVFGVDPIDKICLDVGASTGGFTDVLISRGARRVYAVDVGQGQLHERLQNHPQVISMEQTDARNLTPRDFSTPPQFIVCDASFISVMKVLKLPLTLAAEKAELVTLVKPQFEVGRGGLGKSGIVKSEILAQQALQDVRDWVARQGWQVRQDDLSPIKGGSGNTEYLLYAVK